MRQVFGLREPLAPDEPGPHPARVHPGLHRGPRRRGPAGPDPGRPCRVRGRIATSCSSRAPGTPGSARSSGCRTRPSRRCSVRRRSSCPRAASAGRSTRSSSTRRCSSGTASRSPARSSTRSTSTPSRGSRGRSSVASPGTGSRCSASCRTGRSCRTRPSRWSSRASTARRSNPAPTSTRSSAASRSARWSPSTCSSGSGRAASSSCRATGPTSSRPSSAPARDGSDGGDGRARARPVRRLPAERPRPRRDPAGGPVRDARPRGHLPGRLGAPRPAGQDPPGRRGQDRRDQGAALGVPVHRPRPRGRRGGRGSTDRPVRPSRRAWPGGAIRPMPGPSSATATMTAPTRPSAAHDDEQPGDPEGAGDRATADTEPRIVGQPGAGREDALGGALQSRRRARRQDRDPADEDAREPEPFERRDDDAATTGSVGERGQQRTQHERDRAARRPAARCRTARDPRERVHVRHLDRPPRPPR